jgi:hypothetical protein
MQIQVIALFLQATSALCLAGGVLYAAIQFRQTRKAAHVANFARLVELQMQLRRMRVDDPSLAHVYSHDVERMADDREVREYFMNLMQLSVFEIVWFGHQNGQVPDDYFRSWEKRMREIAAEDSFRKMMSNPSMKLLHDEFEAYVRELVRTTPARR